MTVRLYVEGGARGSWSRCREGFSAFFSKVVDVRKISVIPCGSRNATYRDFCIALNHYPSELVLLLVDSEDEITDLDCWRHLHRRDNWTRTSAAKADDAYLMVRCMESWFLADKEALAGFYGQGFIINSLPNSMDIESISKKDIEDRLDHASKLTTKGRYHKTRHGFHIMALIDPMKVAKRSPHAKRLIDFLHSL